MTIENGDTAWNNPYTDLAVAKGGDRIHPILRTVKNNDGNIVKNIDGKREVLEAGTTQWFTGKQVKALAYYMPSTVAHTAAEAYKGSYAETEVNKE